jgi:predicted HNH restriction endonuclease
MDVHHIKKYRLFEDPNEANNLDNLISLCHSCHSFIHSNSNIDKLYIKE